MSRFNFVGDVETVGKPQLKFIGEVLEKRGFKGPDVLIEQVGAAGDNYVANVKRIVIQEKGTTFKMIAKLATNLPIMRELGNTEALFYNEHVIYTELLPKFRELQENARVPIQELFRFPECYGSSRDIPNETILLEDLKEENYVMLDRFKPLSYDCVKIVLKNLAVYHSLSYVLKHKEPDTFAELSSRIPDVGLEAMEKHDQIRMFLMQIEEQALAVLQNDKHKKFIKGSVSDLPYHAREVRNNKIDPKYSVIIQGDGWTNNIMFQMEGKSPKSCILIDYQMAKESSPAFDIIYSLFNSTSHQQRQKHFREFIDYYHSQMEKSLRYHNLDISTVYPRHQLDADLKIYAKYMLGTSIMLSSFVIRKTEDASKMQDAINNSDMDNMEEAMEFSRVAQDQDTTTLFKSKIEGIVDSFIEFGLLQE